MSWFPVHSDEQFTISLWFDNGVQEGDGPILLFVLYCKPYGQLLRGLFEHERLKPAVIRINQHNVTNLSKLKQVMSSRLLLP